MRAFDWLFRHRHRTDEPFVARKVTGNFYQSASFFPMPFAVVATVDDHGHTSIAPYSLAFPFDLIERPSVMLIARGSSNTVSHLQARGKATLNFIEYDEDWLEAIVRLGYPGQTPDEKMSRSPFELEASPTPERAADPDFPDLLKDAFQVWECELDGSFDYSPLRRESPENAERFLCLRVENILLRESFNRMLEKENDFPSMPISYGFRHQTGERRFFFCEHNPPFAVPVPTDIGPPFQTIYYEANRIDPEVHFLEEACMQLTQIPKPFLKLALRGIIAEAKTQGVPTVDVAFLDAVNRRRKGG
jgi:flavin reductase (DIM6/NTAB) family NADH-FMN oxidoreductase RutF